LRTREGQIEEAKIRDYLFAGNNHLRAEKLWKPRGRTVHDTAAIAKNKRKHNYRRSEQESRNK
jgi:hypothetical protein